MTAKQELRDLVDHLSDAEAAEWLARMARHRRPATPSYATADGRPDYAAILALDVPTRRRVIREWEAEVDLDELRELEGADSDVDLIDD